MSKYVHELIVGDLIDLENDSIADPNKTRLEFLFDFAKVTDIECETPGCIYICTSQGSFRFPPDHIIAMPEDAV